MRKIIVNDILQKKYTYVCTEPVGKHFHPEFKPHLSPKEMLELGVFGGLYMTDCQDEFPKSWFTRAKLSPDGKRHKELNYFNVNASQPLSVWQGKGGFIRTIHEDGFSGIVGTTWEGGTRMMNARYEDGK